MGKPDFWYQSGYDSPFGITQLGNLTKKAGLEHALSNLWGQNQRLSGDTQNRVNQQRGDLTNRYQSIASGNYAVIPDAESALFDKLGREYEGLRDTSDYERGVLTPLRGSFNVARSEAGNRVARTRNSAGYGSLLSELAREEGRQSAQAGYQVGDEKYRRNRDVAGLNTELAKTRFGRADAAHGKQMEGIRGLAEMYGVDMNFLEALLLRGNEILSQGSGIESRRKGVLGTIGGVLGIGSQIGSNIAGGIGAYNSIKKLGN